MAFFIFLWLSYGATTVEGLCLVDFNNLGEFLLGKWVLIESKNKNETTLSLPHKSPVSSVIIEKCNDRLEIKRFPETVKNMRRKNALKNIRIIEFDSCGNVVDTGYPVARMLNDTLVHISSYGKKIKKYYHITGISCTKMTIGRSDVYLKIITSDSNGCKAPCVIETPTKKSAVE